jgi:hypothetical protein
MQPRVIASLGVHAQCAQISSCRTNLPPCSELRLSPERSRCCAGKLQLTGQQPEIEKKALCATTAEVQHKVCACMYHLLEVRTQHAPLGTIQGQARQNNTRSSTEEQRQLGACVRHRIARHTSSMQQGAKKHACPTVTAGHALHPAMATCATATQHAEHASCLHNSEHSAHNRAISAQIHQAQKD